MLSNRLPFSVCLELSMQERIESNAIPQTHPVFPLIPSRTQWVQGRMDAKRGGQQENAKRSISYDKEVSQVRLPTGQRNVGIKEGST